MRHTYALILFATFVTLASADLHAGNASEDTRPNIIVILADDLGYSDLGCYGGEIPTPNIDALATGGVRFTQLYNSARCCPSRASLMTGLYPSQAGIGDFTTSKPSATRGPGYLGRLNDNCATIAEVLKPAGYGCYYVGKWHMHQETGPIKRGFDEFYGYTRDHSHDQYDADYYIRLPQDRKKEIDPADDDFYATDVFNEYALEFIRQGQKTDKPWFLFLGHSSPHFPVQAPADRANKYVSTYKRGWDVLREERYDRMQKLGLIDGEHWKKTPRSLVPVDRDDIANGYSGKPNPAWNSLDENRQNDLARRMAVFAAMVEAVDTGVGKIVEHLQQTDELDNTLILFLSDNGACYEWGPFGFDGKSRRGTTTLRTGDELRDIGGRGTHQSYGSAWANLGNTPFRLYKHFTHEGGISTPFIAHWPRGIGQQSGWVREPAHVMDILPTLMQIADAKYPKTRNENDITPVEGVSLLPAMKGEALPERTIGFDHQAAHAIRQGDWKAVYSKRMPVELKWELYNLAEDRCETNDLAEKYPERLKAMTEDWTAWARRVNVIWEPDSKTSQSPTKPDKDRKPASPNIAQRSITVEVEVKGDDLQGVAIAQGGIQHGYAIHFVNGVPAFDVRINGKAVRLSARKKVTGLVKLKATLTAKEMTLSVDDRAPFTQPSPGLIPFQPLDALTIGYDEKTAAGNYDSPNPLKGQVTKHKVTTKRIATVNTSKSTKASPPNFVFVITDDISPDDLEVYGNTFVPTPNLRKMAANGLVFDNAYLTISSCSPSRCSIITGRYPHNTGAPELHTSLPASQTTFVQKLREAGYHTVISGKNHMASPQQLGFVTSSDSKPAGAERWVEHLRNRPQEKPFFCWFASHDAHSPFTINENAPKFDIDKIEVPPMLFDGPGTRDQLAGFYHEVARTDYYLGEVLNELEKQKLTENTYVIYCSDNGRPFPRCKTYLYESGIQTPLLVTGPNVPQGRTDSLVSSVDFAATILNLAGVQQPESIQGVSFTKVLEDPEKRVRDVVFAERNWHVFQNHARAVRTGDWLYIWNAFPDRYNVSGESANFVFPAAKELWEAAEAGKLSPAQKLLTQKPQPAEMLFNVVDDPYQFTNLAMDDKHQATLETMRQLLDTWKQQTGDSVPQKPTPDRQPIHSNNKGKTIRGDFPGADKQAMRINHPGPVRVDPKTGTPLDPDHWKADSSAPTKFGSITKPLFADPNYHGSCDPEIVWNPAEKEWYIYYTARRAKLKKASYVGTPLGVVSSPDLVNWSFRGYCAFDGKKGRPDNQDTHWAPGVIVVGDRLHMFATYKASAVPPWGGDGVIRHYIAPVNDPVNGWKLVDVPKFNQPDPIDVSLLKMGDRFRAYYRVGKGGGIQWATSQDLTTWKNMGKCPGDVNAKNRGFGYQEAPYVFKFQGKYWMLTDPHEGLAVFHSKDGIKWRQQDRILRKPGTGKADGTLARHPSVAVINNRAFIFYHTEPNRPYPTPPAEQRTPHQKISFLQMAELKVKDGQLVCDRDAAVMLPTSTVTQHDTSKRDAELQFTAGPLVLPH